MGGTNEVYLTSISLKISVLLPFIKFLSFGFLSKLVGLDYPALQIVIAIRTSSIWSFHTGFFLT